MNRFEMWFLKRIFKKQVLGNEYIKKLSLMIQSLNHQSLEDFLVGYGKNYPIVRIVLVIGR